jgi:hypothetical protein
MLYVVKNDIPSSVTIQKDVESDEFSIHVTRDFAPGDVIFENNILHIQKDDTIYMDVNGTSVEIDIVMHTVNRNTYREFYYFDSFTNHSCSPNAQMVYTSPTTCKMVALKHIRAGDEMTNDYTTFDTDNDAALFECRCNAPNCKKFV